MVNFQEYPRDKTIDPFTCWDLPTKKRERKWKQTPDVIEVVIIIINKSRQANIDKHLLQWDKRDEKKNNARIYTTVWGFLVK